MQSRRRRLSPILLLVAISSGASMRAASYLPVADADLVRGAPQIVRAVVLDRESRVDRVGSRDLPFSIVTVGILETLKGTPAESIRMRLPGGTVGGRTWLIPGTPDFDVGEEVVLMIDAIPDGSGEYRLTEFGLSKFDLVFDQKGRRFAIRSVFPPEADRKLSRRDAAGESLRSSSRDAESFLAALRAASPESELPDVLYGVPSGALARHAPGQVHAAWTNIGGTEPIAEFRWFWDTGASPTATAVFSGTQSNLAHDDPCGVDSACFVTNAVTEWSGVVGTDVHLAGPASSGNIQINLDAAVSPDGGIAWNTPLPCSGGVIGEGGPSLASLATPFKGDAPFYAITEAVASFRKFGCASSKYEGRLFKSVVLHEVGHTLGLGHPGRDASHVESTSLHSTTEEDDWEKAVMHWSIPQDQPVTPQTDDVAAMQYFYGPASGPPPTADFEFTLDPTVPSQVRFTDTSTGELTGDAWDFGDPLSGDANVSRAAYHQFSLPGSYTVTLVAANRNGSSTVSKTVQIPKVSRSAPSLPDRAPRSAPHTVSRSAP